MSHPSQESREAAGERLATEISEWLIERLGGRVPETNLTPEPEEYNGQPQWALPCPRAHLIGDDPSNPHQNHGTAATYDGDRTMRLSIYNGQPQMRCFRCTHGPTADTTSEAYTQEVISELGLEIGNIQGIGPRWEETRQHHYPREDGVLIKRMMRKENRRGPADRTVWWAFETPEGDRIRIVKEEYADGRTARTAMDVFSMTTVAAAGLYNRAGIAARPDAVVVFCEGEKDVDTAERIFLEAGLTDRYVATTAPSMSASADMPGSLRDPFADRTVIAAFDADQAGDGYHQTWPQFLWDITSAWSRVEFPRGMDLTDYVEANDDDALIQLLSDADPVTERPVPADHWRIMPVRNSTGAQGPKTDSPLNAVHLMRYHPALSKALRVHKLTGQVVTLDVPFAEGVKVWTNERLLALEIAEFSMTEGLTLSPKAFTPEAVRKVAHETDLYSPHDELLETPWDGTGRAETLFSSYLPIDAAAEQQRALSRHVLMDLVRALSGEPRQGATYYTALLVEDTELGSNVADMIAAPFGDMKTARRVKEQDVVSAMRDDKVMMQYPLGAITSFQNWEANGSVFQARNFTLRDGTIIGAPSFLFVGSNQTEMKFTPELMYLETLRLKEAKGSVEADMPQIIAETLARREEWALLPKPVINSDQRNEAQEHRFKTIGDAIARYILTKVDSDIDTTMVCDYRQIMQSPPRTNPLDKLVVSEFRTSMSLYLKHVYGTSFSERKVNTDVTAFYRFFTNQPDLKRTQVYHNGRQPAGFRVTNAMCAGLRTWLWGAEAPDGENDPEDDDPRGPDDDLHTSSAYYAENEADVCIDNDLEIKEKEDNLHTTQMTSPAHGKEILPKKILRAHIIDHIGKGSVCGVEQPVVDILASPGVVGLDFETHPGSWKYWKAKFIAEGTWPKDPVLRKKLETRNAFDNAPPQRKPCIITVSHKDGRKALLRLTGTLAERRETLRRLFSHLGDETELVAHNAQFEQEVLVAAGIEVEVECTMLAAKAIYGEALSFDKDDEEDGAQGWVDVASPDEDIGIADKHGQLALDQLTPLGKMRGSDLRSTYSLKACLRREFGIIRDKTLRDIDWDSPESDAPEYQDYALADAVDVVDLWALYKPALEQLQLWEGYNLYKMALLPIAEINITGMVTDPVKHRELMDGMKAEMGPLDEQMMELTGGIPLAKRNLNSETSWWIVEQMWEGYRSCLANPDDLPAFGEVRAERDWEALEAGRKTLPCGWYYHLLVTEIHRETGVELGTTKGSWYYWDPTDQHSRQHSKQRIPGVGFDKSALATLEKFLTEYPMAPTLLRYVQLHKQRNSLAVLIGGTDVPFTEMRNPYTRRLTGQHQVSGTVTWRQSCAAVNLQQVATGGGVREEFIADEGCKLIVADYSQVELRVGAIIAQDEVLIDVYRRGMDVHTATAARCYHVSEEEVEDWQRKKAKNVNFGAFYGASGGAIARTIGGTLEEGQTLLDAFLDAYPGIKQYREESSDGSGDIWMRPGLRLLAAPDVKGPKRTNYPIQGGAAGVQHRALVRLFTRIRAEGWRGKVRLCAAVHDEIIVECPAEIADVVRDAVDHEMSQALLEIYPECIVMGEETLVSAAVGDSWAEK